MKLNWSSWNDGLSRDELSELERQERALELLNDPFVRDVFLALDALGWKVVPRRASAVPLPHQCDLA